MGSEFVQKAIGKATPPIAFISCALVSGMLFASYYIHARFGNDFSVYWRTANNPVETAYALTWTYPFPYAPTMLLWIEPLSLVPKWPAYFLFIAASTVAFVLACRPYLSKAAIALTLLCPPFWRGIFTGQVCAILAALIIWACGTRNRILAGVAFGVVASIKPQLVIMAPLMLALNRDWRAFISAGVSFLLVVLLSVVVFGPERWPEWIASMDNFQRAILDLNVARIGVTPAMWAEWMGLHPFPFILAGTVVGAFLVYLCRAMGPLEQATAIVAGSLMAAPYALDYDLIALYPFLALSAMQGRIWAIPGLIASFHPLPLGITAFGLLRGQPISRYVRKPKEDSVADPVVSSGLNSNVKAFELS